METSGSLSHQNLLQKTNAFYGLEDDHFTPYHQLICMQQDARRINLWLRVNTIQTTDVTSIKICKNRPQLKDEHEEDQREDKISVKDEPKIIEHTDHWSISSHRDSKSTINHNSIPFRGVNSDFAQPEELYRSQYRPTQSRTDRIEYLHRNSNVVSSDLFNYKEILSPLGWLWATGAARTNESLDISEADVVALEN